MPGQDGPPDPAQGRREARPRHQGVAPIHRATGDGAARGGLRPWRAHPARGDAGTGLSIYHGSYLHVTSRDTTASGCPAGAGIPPTRVRRVTVVFRTYPIRVMSPAK